MINANIEQHFRHDELPFLNECQDFISQVQGEYRPVLTHFLNPRQQYLLQIMVNGEADVQLQFNGGHSDAEMKRGLLFPDYFTPKETDFKIAMIEIKYPIKFTSIHHSQILGSFLGTGIKRNVLGDILTDGTRWQCVIDQKMVSFVMDNVTKIGRNKVVLVNTALSEIIHPIDEWRNQFETISSMRLDNVIASGFNLSRHQAKELVQNEKVHLNWGTFSRPDYEVDLHDVISVRGFGRLMVNSIAGLSKRGKLKINMAILKK